MSPPNAIIDTPTALCANTTTSARVRLPLPAAPASDQNTATLAPTTSSRLHSTGFSRSRVASYCSACRRVRRVDETIDRPVGEAEEPQLLRGGRIDRHPEGVVGVALRGAHDVGVAVPPDRALAQQPVRGQPRPAQDDRGPPRIREEHHRAGEPADQLDQAAGDEVHGDAQRRTGHAEVEITRDGQIAGERRVLEMSHARRPDARLGQPVVEPRGGAVAEIGAHGLVNRREHLEQDEHRADEGERTGEAGAVLDRARRAHPWRWRTPRAARLAERARPTRRRRAGDRLRQHAEELPLVALAQTLQHHDYLWSRVPRAAGCIPHVTGESLAGAAGVRCGNANIRTKNLLISRSPDLRFNRDADAPRALYARLLGSSWLQLAEPVRFVHSRETTARAHGRLRIQHGRSLAARILARLLRLPRPADAAETRLVVTSHAGGERWLRTFADRRFDTRQYLAGGPGPADRGPADRVPADRGRRGRARRADWPPRVSVSPRSLGGKPRLSTGRRRLAVGIAPPAVACRVWRHGWTRAKIRRAHVRYASTSASRFLPLGLC